MSFNCIYYATSSCLCIPTSLGTSELYIMCFPFGNRSYQLCLIELAEFEQQYTQYSGPKAHNIYIQINYRYSNYGQLLYIYIRYCLDVSTNSVTRPEVKQLVANRAGILLLLQTPYALIKIKFQQKVGILCSCLFNVYVYAFCQSFCLVHTLSIFQW